ncbi:MAG TPA: DUF72 domain-containing protein [Gammaproteobacteria bacterium]|nr:DUF72 domain-containing protein [Gammaproteobacteria bacterium]
MAAEILIGTCGFARSQARTFAEFGIVEIQQSFYQPPHLETAQRWRARAPAGFTFTLKAWQLLTHRADSPTYRRLQTPLSPRQLSQAGGLRWNRVTRMAWRRTLELALALQAEAVVFQTPPSFLPTEAHLERLRRFFTAIDRQDMRMVFEPRGEAWTDAIMRPLCADLHLVHGVDPFLRPPASAGMRYYRLHGRPAYHYRYRYSDIELETLYGMLAPGQPNRILFNNDHMAEDALRFLRVVKRRQATTGITGDPPSTAPA